MLGAALRNTRGEEVERWKPELNLGAGGSFPGYWIPYVNVRLSLYVRLGRIEGESALEGFEEELVDRFSALLPEAETLVAHARVRSAARALRIERIERIDAGAATIAITPRRDFIGNAIGAGLVEKGERFLLVEPTEAADRSDRVATLLECLAA